MPFKIHEEWFLKILQKLDAVAQATSLAIAVIEADYVITASAHIRYKIPAHVGDMLVARAKVGTHKQNKYIVSVRTKVEGKEIFVGRFIVVALESFP